MSTAGLQWTFLKESHEDAAGTTSPKEWEVTESLQMYKVRLNSKAGIFQCRRNNRLIGWQLKAGVGKLWTAGQIWPTTYFLSKVFLEQSHIRFFYAFYGSFGTTIAVLGYDRGCAAWKAQILILPLGPL